jgi:hypothetical protein
MMTIAVAAVPTMRRNSHSEKKKKMRKCLEKAGALEIRQATNMMRKKILRVV